MRTYTKQIIIVSLVTTNIDKEVAVERQITLVDINKQDVECLLSLWGKQKLWQFVKEGIYRI